MYIFDNILLPCHQCLGDEIDRATGGHGPSAALESGLEGDYHGRLVYTNLLQALHDVSKGSPNHGAPEIYAIGSAYIRTLSLGSGPG